MLYAPVQSARVHNLFVSARLWIATAFAATQPGFAESTESGHYTTDCYTDNCCCPFDGCADNPGQYPRMVYIEEGPAN